MAELPECLRLGTELGTHLSTIKLKMRKFWEKTLFHHFTDHGFNHSERIIAQLAALLEEYPDLLNDQERFILLSSAYLHDVGMQSLEYAGLEKKEYTEYTLEEIERVRELHHISGSQMIIDSIRSGIGFDFGLGDCKEFVSFISEVSKYHTGLDITELKDTHNIGELIRIPFLAALMKLGDALDMDHRRVNLDVLSLWDIPVLSKFHWWAHHYVRSVHISKGKIRLIFRFREASRDTAVIVEFRKKVEDSLKRHLEEVYEILDRYGVRLFHEPQIEDVVYEPEGVLEPIPDDLHSYLETQVKELASIQDKTGVQFYFNGVPYSDDVKVAESNARIRELLSEERYNAARVEVERCLTFALSPWQRIVVLNLAGNVYLVLGDLNGALQRCQDGLRISERADLRNIYGNDFLQARATSLGNIGIVYRAKGELNKALKHHREALDIDREIGYRKGEADQLGNMGLVYHVRGELDEALKHYQETLVIDREIGYRKGEASALGNMGLVYHDRGELDEALKHHREALEIDREIGYRQGEATRLGNMGIVYREKGELDEALKHHREALEIDREIGYRQGEASDLGNMGIVYHDRGELDEALKHYQETLVIDREIGYRKGEANQLGNMGLVYHDKGELDEAVKNLEDALDILREIHSNRVEYFENLLKEIKEESL